MQTMGFGISLVHFIQSYVCKGCCYYYRAPLPVMFKFDAFQLVLLVFSVTGLTWYVKLEIDITQQENTLLGVACISGWYFCLFFTRVFRTFSFFTVMLHRILVGDVLRFAIVFVVVLLGFGVALRVMFAERLIVLQEPDDLKTGSKTFETMYRLMLGLSSMEYLDQATQTQGAVVIFILFTAITTILLLNMLIAAMSDTYAKLNVNGESLWHKQRIASVLWMEHYTPKFMLGLTSRNYSEYDEKKGVYMLSVSELVHEFSKNEKHHIIEAEVDYPGVANEVVKYLPNSPSISHSLKRVEVKPDNTVRL